MNVFLIIHYFPPLYTCLALVYIFGVVKAQLLDFFSFLKLGTYKQD